MTRAEQLFLYGFGAILLLSSLATFLAELGIFSLGLCLAIAFSLGIAGAIFTWRRRLEAINSPLASYFSILAPFTHLRKMGTPWSIGALLVLGLAGFLFSRPAEAIIVMDDAGVYVIHGLTLARTGQLAIHDPFLLSIPTSYAEELFPFVWHEPGFIRHEGAFHIWNWWRGLIQPSFFHFSSVWMALIAQFAGERQAVWATPLAGLLSILALLLLGRRLWGPATALAATLLLTVSFPQVWYARYPTSEMFAQAWLLGGIFLLAIFLQTHSRRAGLLAGIALGQTLFIRIDTGISLFLIGLCLVLWTYKDHLTMSPHPVPSRWFLVPFGATLIWAGLHAALFAPAYTMSLARLYLTPRLSAMIVGGLALLIIVAGSAWNQISFFRTLYHKTHSLTQSWRAIKPVGMFATVGIAGLITLVSLVRGEPWPSILDLEGIRWLQWYYTPFGLFAVLVGLGLLLNRELSRPAQVLLLIALAYTLLYLPAPRARPVQPWGIRRFVPEVAPVIALLMAYATTRLPLIGPLRLQQGGRLILVLLLASALARNTRPILAHQEYAGVWEQIEQLADAFEPDAVIFFNHTGVGQAVAQPLQYLYGYQTFVLQAEEPDLEMLRKLTDQWSKAGHPIYLAITDLAPWMTRLGLASEPAGAVTLRIPRLARSMDQLPQTFETLVWHIDLYRLYPDTRIQPVERLEMGPGEQPYLVGGFYGRETAADGTTFRWTNGNSRLQIPVQPDSTRLTLRVSGPPAGVDPITLHILVDGEEVGTLQVGSEFSVGTFQLPPQASTDGWLDIVIQSNTWVPQEAGLGNDTRHLGVVLDWITLE